MIFSHENEPSLKTKVLLILAGTSEIARLTNKFSSVFRLRQTLWLGMVSAFCFVQPAQAQTPSVADMKTMPKGVVSKRDADSLFIGGFQRKNDFRVFYGTQALSLEYGSRKESSPATPSIYSNVNDFAGFGFTYKIIDVDLSFSLPKTRVLNQDLQNLSQFRLAAGFTTRKWIFRGYYSDMTGMIASDPQGRYESRADVHQTKIGGQITYIVNHQRYSYRAATYQNEFQRRTAGSLLLRVEPFYRTLGAGSRMVPAAYDVPELYGEQVGLQYIKAPGFLLMPGYGVTLTSPDGNFFVSPIVFAGAGVAFNYYTGSLGDFAYTNWELGGTVALNAGYNNSRFYADVGFTDEINYIPLNPSFFATNSLRMTLRVGYRFNDLEKKIPSGL